MYVRCECSIVLGVRVHEHAGAHAMYLKKNNEIVFFLKMTQTNILPFHTLKHKNRETEKEKKIKYKATPFVAIIFARFVDAFNDETETK